ncbi:MAG: methionine--tRNA ligase [Euryarchaeota archaeon]|nr:methionine--tRNA ligase [Euryarchaeota archaeon]
MASEYVLICVAWPYANGPLHLGHVAGCYLPPDIQYRFQRALGNRVLMVSGSDEHGTPITVSAETEGVDPQDIVDRYHGINKQALIDLGCSWERNIDTRGVEFGGSLFNRTSDPLHKKIVKDQFEKLYHANLFEKKSMNQYYEENNGRGRFLPDRYIEGECPHCSNKEARGDQCDECGQTYEASELINPRSKMNPDSVITVKETEHLFYRLDVFQDLLEKFAQNHGHDWKANVKAMTKNWLKMGLRPRAVTRDMEWGIEIPLGQEWAKKRIYVWFEAVQGYLSCAKIWSSTYGEGEEWKLWWNQTESSKSKHMYFLGKDNIPFHTIIWPSIILGLNMANGNKSSPSLPTNGELKLPSDVPAMEYLMLSGGQFSKSRKHAIWLPSFLERHHPDTLRYYLSINMPENHDTDFNWPDFIEKINNELIAAYGNFVHRVFTLGNRFPESGLINFENQDLCREEMNYLENIHNEITSSLNKHRYKEALRHVMSAAQYGNQMLQKAEPWKFLKQETDAEHQLARQSSFAKLSFSWRVTRFLAITSQPFLPKAAASIWNQLGEVENIEDIPWQEAVNWDAEMKWNHDQPTPLFKRLDLDEILETENQLIDESETSQNSHQDPVSKEQNGDDTVTEGLTSLKFDDFLKVEMTVGKIKSVEDHPNADKLYVVNLDDGSENGRTICAGIKEHYSISELEGLMVIFVANLAPRKLRGVVSEGMMLAAENDDGLVKLLTVDSSMSPGSRVR